MHDLPEAEARALLQSSRTCPECPDWLPVKGQRETRVTEAGLLDRDGIGIGLFASMLFHLSGTTGLATYKFSVFRVTKWGRERVYQLHVKHLRRPGRDWHQLPHEHFGDRRVDGDASWLGWRYDAALQHFCQATNIAFDPPLPDPEVLELRP